MTEISEDVIEKAAEALIGYSANSNSRWAGIPEQERESARSTVKLVADVIWNAAWEQALDDAEQAVLGADGFRVIGYTPRGVDEDSALRNIAALRRKEGGE